VSAPPATEATTPASALRLARIGAAGGILLGLILLFAALLKALDPNAFAEEIASQGAGFGLPGAVAALAALAVETALGAALVLNLRRRAVLVAATLLVAFFLFLTGRAAWRAAHGEIETTGCGCFGALVERTPAEAFGQDLAMLVPTLGLAWLGRPGARRAVRLRATAAGALTLGVVGLAYAAPGLPLDDYATRLRPGVALADLCGGADEKRVCLADLAPALTHGRHLVVLADAGGESFAPLAERLNAYVRRGEGPPLSVLADLTPDQRFALFWQVAPAFDLHETPQALLRPLYRTLPRAFLVEEGRVVETWGGLPPELAAPESPGTTRSGDPT